MLTRMYLNAKIIPCGLSSILSDHLIRTVGNRSVGIRSNWRQHQEVITLVPIDQKLLPHLFATSMTIIGGGKDS